MTELKTICLAVLYSVATGCTGMAPSDRESIRSQGSADTLAPVPGSFLAPSAKSDKSVTLRWTKANDSVTAEAALHYTLCSGESVEAIDSIEECVAANIVMTDTADVVTAKIDSLNPATTYHYNLLVKDAAGNQAAYSPTSVTTDPATVDKEPVAIDATAPTAGTFTAATAITASTFTLNWSKASDNVSTEAALSYFVCSGATSASIDTIKECEAATKALAYTAGVTTLNVTGQAPATTLYFNVIVKDRAGNKVAYAPTSVTTLSIDTTAPTAATFNATTAMTYTTFTLNWVKATDNKAAQSALQYLVCTGASSADIDTFAECEAATVAMAYAANVATLNVTGKTPATTYYYNVVVKDPAGNKAAYTPTSVTTTADSTAPAAGVFQTTTAVEFTTLTLNWTKGTDAVSAQNTLSYLVCSGADSVDIDLVTECEAATEEMTWTTDVATLNVSGKDHSTSYYFNIVVRDEAGNKTAYLPTPVTTKNAFISTWNTGIGGTSNIDQIDLPLDCTGSFNFTVDWGDGTSATITSCSDGDKTHTYPSPGPYTVKMIGEINGWGFAGSAESAKMVNISQWGPLKLANTPGQFSGAANLTITATDILDLGGTTTLANAFANCTSLTLVPNIGLWDTSGVTSMVGAFDGATNFNDSLDGWDTSSVTNMASMFYNAASFNQDLNSWDVSAVIDMRDMFGNATSFNGNISSWDVTAVIELGGLFAYATSFNRDISSWQPINAAGTWWMFYGASSFNQNIGGWNMSSVTDMDSMFANASSFNQDLGNWNISNANDMVDLFASSGLSQANYDALLIGWADRALNNGVQSTNALTVSTNYTAGGPAEAARDYLINNFGWTFTDLGAN